jgi:hypothetical protein
MDGLPELLYIAFAFAAILLLSRWWSSRQFFIKPCWGFYLAHLPIASLAWTLELWDTARWISVLGNLLLIFCVAEAADQCGWWIIPPKVRWRVVLSACGVGVWMAGLIARGIKIPPDQPWPYYLVKACAPAACIGILTTVWFWQRIKMGRHPNNSRNAWHVWLLFAYCFLAVLNAVDYAPPRTLEWEIKTYATVTLKVGLFICWWFKVCPTLHRRALPV